MKSVIVKDWNQVDFDNPQDMNKLVGAMNNFFSVPNTNATIKAALQNFATPQDFPDNVLQILDKFRVTPTWDENWRRVFKVIDFTGTNESGWSILDVEDSMTFSEVPIGGKAKIFKMGGSKVNVEFAMYAAGLGWPQQLFDDRQYWALEDNAISFRNKAFLKRSQVYYALIDGVSSSQNLIWQAVTPATVATSNENYNAIRDFNTINKACETILLALDGSSIPVSPSSPFILLYPIQLVGRIRRAMGVQNVGISAGMPGLNYNVTPISTMMLSAADKYYVILPGEKAQAGIRLELEIKNRFDPVARSEIAVGWQRFGGVIGNANQFQRCSVAD